MATVGSTDGGSTLRHRNAVTSTADDSDFSTASTLVEERPSRVFPALSQHAEEQPASARVDIYLDDDGSDVVLHVFTPSCCFWGGVHIFWVLLYLGMMVVFVFSGLVFVFRVLRVLLYG